MSEFLISDLVKLQAWDTPTICNALDIEHIDMPAKPEKIWKIINDKILATE